MMRTSIPELNSGEKIKLYRKRARCSQFKLEIDAELGYGAVSRIERNTINPSKETLLKIGKALALSPIETADLFGIKIDVDYTKRLN